MRKFLIRAAAFMAILIVIFGGLSAAVVIAEISAYHRELIAPAGKEIVVCGDSQSETGLDPEVWPELFNFSASGRTLDQDCLVAEDVLSSNPSLRVLLVDVSPERASVDPSVPIGKMRFASDYYLLHWLHRDRQRRSLEGSFVVFRDCMVGDRFKKAFRSWFGGRRFDSALKSGFRPQKGALAVMKPDSYRKRLRLKVGFMRTVPVVTRDAPAFEILDSLVSIASRYRVHLVLTTLPWREDLIGSVAPEKIRGFSESIRAYAFERGLDYIDLLHEQFGSEHWHDCNHLTPEGARRLTEMVRQRLYRLEGGRRVSLDQ